MKHTLVAAALVGALALTGCTFGATTPVEEPRSSAYVASSEQDAEQRESLERYVEAERAQIPEILDATPGLYSEVRIDPQASDSIVFTYVYAQRTDPAAASDHFDGLIPTFQDLCDSTLFPAMASFGLDGTLHAKYIYLNPDGSTIWEKTFTSA